MDLKRGFLLLISLLFYFNLSYGGELLAPEAVNYYNEGVKAQKASNFAAAENSYQKIFLLDPYNPKWQKFILHNRAIMYAQQGDLEKAEASFNEVLEMDPNYQPAKLNLGFIYEQRRSKLESIEYWLKVLNINLDEAKPKGFIMQESPQTENK